MNNEKQIKEAVQMWADTLAFNLQPNVRSLSKSTCSALLALFDWPQMLRSSIAITDLKDALKDRLK